MFAHVLGRLAGFLEGGLTVHELDRQIVCSSAVVSVGFDPRKNVLQVEYFNGCVYEVVDVSASVFETLKASGRFDRDFKSLVLTRMRLIPVGRVAPVFSA